MGTLAVAAKITHVPSMYFSEIDGPCKSKRQAAIAGHHDIDRRCRALGVDTIVVLDTHWLVNADHHINCAPHWKGAYTSNELPYFISNLPCALDVNPGLGQLMAEVATACGVFTRAHPVTTLAPEHGTLVPMRMLPEYAAKGHGEGFMHNTAMLLGALGWNHYIRGVEVVAPFSPGSGTAQINAVFPVSPMPTDLQGIGRPGAPTLAGLRL